MNLLWVLFLIGCDSQIISLTLCSDNSCSNNCASAFVNVGICYTAPVEAVAAYSLGPIEQQGSLTFYSDSQCTTAIAYATHMTLFMDSGCKTLYGANDGKMGSYKASNVSGIIGGVASFSVAVGACFLGYCLYKRQRRQRIAQLTVGPIGPTAATASAAVGPTAPGPTATPPVNVDDVIPIVPVRRLNINLSINPFYSNGLEDYVKSNRSTKPNSVYASPV